MSFLNRSDDCNQYSYAVQCLMVMRLTGVSNGEWFLRAHDRYSLAATRQLAKVSEMLTKKLLSLSYSGSSNNSLFFQDSLAKPAPER